MTPKAWKRLFARIALWAGIVLGFFLLIVLANETRHLYGKEQEAKQAHLNEAEELSQLQQRQQTLTAQLNALNTFRGLDQEIRERYPVAQSGEEIIILTNNPNESSTSSEPSQDFWGTLFSWF